MKLFLTLLMLLTFSATAPAQTALDEQIALARQSAQTDRKLILLGNMSFTSEESAQFWPAWNEYRAAVAANGDRRLALIKNFAENYESMSNMKASELLTDHFSISMQDLVIKQDFAKKIDEFMPTQKVMRVIQIENKLDAAINMKLASEIPLTK